MHTHVPNATDYSGATPQAGPFTTLPGSAANAVGMTALNPQTSGTALQQEASNRGAVPLSPQGPADITAPVEMAQSEPSQAGSPPAVVPGGSPSPGGGRRAPDYFTLRQSRVREMEGGSPPVELPATPMEKP